MTLINFVLAGSFLVIGILGILIWRAIRQKRQAGRCPGRPLADLPEREWAFRQAQRIAQIGTCIYDDGTKSYVCCEEWGRLFGLPPSSAGRQDPEVFLALVHRDDRALSRKAFARMQRGEAAAPLRLRLPTDPRGERVLAVAHSIAEKTDRPSSRVIATAQDITERVAAEQVLAKNHRHLETLMRTIPGVIFQLHRNSAGLFSAAYVSDGATALFGYSPSAFIQLLNTFMVASGQRGSDPFLLTLETSAETMRPWHYEVKLTSPDGTARWARFAGLPLRTSADNEVEWNGVALNVTEIKQAEEASREHEHRLRMTQFAVDHVRDAVAFVSADGDRIYVNEETCRLTGYGKEELLQTKIWSTFASFTLETYRQIWSQVKERGTYVFDTTLHARDGQRLFVEVRLSFIGFDGQELLFAIAQDISGRKAAEQLLRDSEERLRFTRYALDHAHDFVSIIDRAGQRLYVNDTFCQFTARPREELAQSMAWEYIPALNQERYQALWDEIKRRQTLSYEIEFAAKNGELKALEVNASFINFGGTEAVCAISRDLSVRRSAEQEKKRLQQQLQETQKLESLGVLAGGIAHDFNNLLTGVLGNASLARDRLVEGSDLHEPLRQIEQAALRAAELCQQMLAYAGKGRFVVEPLDLSALVGETAKLLDLSVARRAQLELRLPSGLPPVLADATQLRQIVMNLVLNAAEAIPHSNGHISVVTGRMQVDQKFLHSARVAAEFPDGEGIFLEVSDNGTGMDRKTQERIFEPFFTTKFTGRGLGLAAVLGIVRSHRGALQVLSEQGRGTTIRLVLAPHNGAALAAPGTPPVFPRAKRNQGHLLVVDDEESVRSVVAQALERTGFTVEMAPDGESAVARLRETPNGFAVILLDYTMPRLDGAETLREIRRISPAARVILMSGFPEEEARERMGDASLAGFIQKPFDISTLRRRVEEVVQSEPLPNHESSVGRGTMRSIN